ncbi:hypothetical protein Daus18300_002863 [Diaporthe australafricana]|uniref:Heme haloperoxidase family profile domain-containing protein n=1 Tax=Diaporthe australafricana TaxID=127596 RepID=A0ABR3XJU1_9PEZI
MKVSQLPLAMALGPVFALPGDWAPPGDGDVRAPCPMLNTLANHGYLPRDGRNINKAMAVDVLSSVLNWDVSVVNDLFDFAQPTNPAPNATTIDLNHLTTHNILEHDGSLSRQDANFGPADVFNDEIWNETIQYFTGPTIDLAMASKARTARLVTSAATNPQFTLPQLGAHFIYGETAAYQLVFGKWNLGAEETKDMVLTPKELVQYFFVNERLPLELGWKKPENRLNMTTLQNVVFIMQDITLGQMNGTTM